MTDYCPRTGKQRFRNKADALKVVRRTHQRHQGTPSLYFCTECHAWHLTHYEYSHCKAIRQMKEKGYYGETSSPPPKPKQRDMKIFIDTDTPGTDIAITLPNPTEGTQLQLSLVRIDVGTHHTLLTYSQTQELIEALKIQAAKLKINT